MFVCLGAVVIGCVIGYVLHTHIIGWFMKTVPNDVLKSQGDTLYTFTPAESFLTSLWISIYFGIVLAMPVIFWQVWQFFVPAVDKQHGRGDRACGGDRTDRVGAEVSVRFGARERPINDPACKHERRAFRRDGS